MAKSSQQPLSSQLNLARSLALLESASRNTYSGAVGKLDLVFNLGERTRAVVWEVDASYTTQLAWVTGAKGEQGS